MPRQNGAFVGELLRAQVEKFHEKKLPLREKRNISSATRRRLLIKKLPRKTNPFLKLEASPRLREILKSRSHPSLEERLTSRKLGGRQRRS
jgi:hypothetical protein